MYRAALFLMMVSAPGCAGSQPVRPEMPSGARIGILNLLEKQMTHVDVGSLRFDSFTNIDPVEWDLPAYINRRIESGLKARGNYGLFTRRRALSRLSGLLPVGQNQASFK